VEKDVGQLVTSFGKGFTVLEQELERDLTGEEKVIFDLGRRGRSQFAA
jgi:hypothetical protein